MVSHYKKIGYNINVFQQTACLVVNQMTVDKYAFLYYYTPLGWTSDSIGEGQFVVYLVRPTGL